MLLKLTFLLSSALFIAACGSGDSEPAPTSTQPPPTVVQSCDIDTSLPAAVLVACEDLLTRSGETPDEVVSVMSREWTDTCLGVPEPGEICAEAVVPGYEVLFAVGSNRYTYHTDEDTNVRFAGFEIRRPGEDAGAEVVARGLGAVAFDFTPDGRLLFNLRELGEIRAVDLASGVADDGAVFAEVEVFTGSECGLIGIAVDPEFASNGYVYVYATQPVADTDAVGKPRVIRYTDVDGVGMDPLVIVDDLPRTNPRTCAHVGGNLHFGPDGYLYLSIGNNERSEEAVAANLGSPLGKILRLNKEDGSAAPGNPFDANPNADPRVYAYGLRNSFDFAFHPVTGEIYAPDNGPGNCDELNLIKAGLDYGVPDSLPPANANTCLGLGGQDPIYLFTREGVPPSEFGSNVAPAGVAFLRDGTYPGLGTGLLVCEFLTGSLRYLEFEGVGQDIVSRDEVIFEPCRFNVEIGPDGLVYYSFDDAILRLPPAALVP